MTGRELIDFVNSRPQEYLEKDNSGRGFVCPSCGNGTHKTGSEGLRIDPNGAKPNRLKCFSCGLYGGAFDMLAIAEGLDPKDRSGANMGAMLDAVARRTNLPLDDWHGRGDRPSAGRGASTHLQGQQREQQPPEPPVKLIDYAPYMGRIKPLVANTDYLTARGISSGVIARHDIGFDESFNAGKGQKWRAVVFFTSSHSYEARNTDGGAGHGDRYRKSKGKQHIWNLSALAQKRPVFVTEGIIDALSVESAGGIALAVSGAGTEGLVAAINERRHKKLHTPPIILLFDADGAGNGTTERTRAQLRGAGMGCLDGRDIYAGKGKDANEVLLSDPEGLKERIAIMERRASWEQEREAGQVATYLDDIREEIAQADRLCSTGYPMLDDALGGGLYPGLIFMGAISAAGKTTLVLQLADQIAAQGVDVIYISLEMSRLELVSKSISRLTMREAARRARDDEGQLKRLARTARGVMVGNLQKNLTDQQREVLDTAFDSYRDKVASHLYIVESVGDTPVDPLPPPEGGEGRRETSIRERVERHIRRTGRKPVVVIDYLQIIRSPDVHLSDKQATDRNVKALKQLSRDYGLAIVGISSFNRDNYTAPVNLASFKESGAIEYSADVLLGLQYRGMDYREGEKDGERKKRLSRLNKRNGELGRSGQPITMQLKILKQRFGKKDESVFYSYWPWYNAYDEEIGEPVAESAEEAELYGGAELATIDDIF